MNEIRSPTKSYL